MQNYEVINFWQPHSLPIFYHFPQHSIPSLPQGTTSAVNNNSTFPPNFLLKKNILGKASDISHLHLNVKFFLSHSERKAVFI